MLLRRNGSIKYMTLRDKAPCGPHWVIEETVDEDVIGRNLPSFSTMPPKRRKCMGMAQDTPST